MTKQQLAEIMAAMNTTQLINLFFVGETEFDNFDYELLRKPNGDLVGNWLRIADATDEVIGLVEDDGLYSFICANINTYREQSSPFKENMFEVVELITSIKDITFISNQLYVSEDGNGCLTFDT